MADGKVLLEVVVEGKNVKVVQRQVEQVTDAVNENTGAQDRNTKASRKNAQAANEASKAHDHFDRGLKGASGSSSNTTKNFSKMRDAMSGSSGLVGAYATLAANLFAATAAFAALQRAAQVEQLTQGLVALGQASGLSMVSLSKGLQESTKYSISLQDSMRQVAQITSAGFDTSVIERLGTVATNTSVALGRDVQDSMNRLVKGATKLEPELLDELGIMVRIDEASQKYAQSLGKSASQLTNFEKRQGFMNAVLAEGEQKFGAIGDNVDANPYDRLSATLQELGTTILNFFNTVLGPVAGFFAESKLALAGFIGILSKGIISQALPVLSQMANATAMLAVKTSQQAEIEKEAAAVEVQARKASMASLEGVLGKRGQAIDTALEEANSLKELSRVQTTVNKSIAARVAIEEKDIAAGRVSSQTAQLVALRAYHEELKKVIEAEARRAALASGAKGPALEAKTSLLVKGAERLGSLDEDPSFKNYREQFAKSLEDAKAYRETMQKELGGITWESFTAQVSGAFSSAWQSIKDFGTSTSATFTAFRARLTATGTSTAITFQSMTAAVQRAGAAFTSFGNTARIAIKGIFTAIPFIGQVLFFLDLLIQGVTWLFNLFRSDEGKVYADSLDKAGEATKELATNSKEVNLAVLGASKSITSQSQLIDAQSNIVSTASSEFNKLKNAQQAAVASGAWWGTSVTKITDNLNTQIESNSLLQKEFQNFTGQTGKSYSNLNEYIKENNLTEEQGLKISEQFLEVADKKIKAQQNLAKSVKDTNDAFTQYINKLKVTSEYTALREKLSDSIKALEGAQNATEGFVNTLTLVQGLSQQQINFYGLKEASRDFKELNSEANAIRNLETIKVKGMDQGDAAIAVNQSLKALGLQNIALDSSQKQIDEARVRALESVADRKENILATEKKLSDEIQIQLKRELEIIVELDRRATTIAHIQEMEKAHNEIIKEQGFITRANAAERDRLQTESFGKEFELMGLQLKEAKRFLDAQAEGTIEREQAEAKFNELKKKAQLLTFRQQKFINEAELRAAQDVLTNIEHRANKEREVLSIIEAQITAAKSLMNANEENARALMINANLKAGGTGEVSAVQELELFKRFESDKKKAIEAEKDAKIFQIRLEEKVNTAKLGILKAQITLAQKELRKEGLTKEADALGGLLSGLDKVNYDTIANLQLQEANINRETQLVLLENDRLEREKSVIIAYEQAAVEIAQSQLDMMNVVGSLQDKITSARSSALDNEKKIRENELKTANFKNESLNKFEMTAQQTLELEIEFADKKKRLIQEEASRKKEVIMMENKLLAAQLKVQRIQTEESLRTLLSSGKLNATQEIYEVKKLLEELPNTFDKAAALLPEALRAQLREVNSAAAAQVSEVDASVTQATVAVMDAARENTVKIIEAEIEALKTVSDIQDRITASKSSVLDSERTIRENELKATNLRNKGIGEYALTSKQSLDLEIEFGEKRKALILQERDSRLASIDLEFELLAAQLHLQEIKMKSDLELLKSTAQKEGDTAQLGRLNTLEQTLSGTFKKAGEMLPAAAKAAKDEVTSGAAAQISEISAGQIEAAEKVFGWTQKMTTSWEDVSEAIGQNFIKTLENAKSITQELADIFYNSVNAAADAFIDAIVEGKNVFKGISDALRNSIKEGLAEAAKAKLKEGIAAGFGAIFEKLKIPGFEDLSKILVGPQERAAKASEEAVNESTGIPKAVEHLDSSLIYLKQIAENTAKCCGSNMLSENDPFASRPVITDSNIPQSNIPQTASSCCDINQQILEKAEDSMRQEKQSGDGIINQTKNSGSILKDHIDNAGKTIFSVIEKLFYTTKDLLSSLIIKIQAGIDMMLNAAKRAKEQGKRDALVKAIGQAIGSFAPTGGTPSGASGGPAITDGPGFKLNYTPSGSLPSDATSMSNYGFAKGGIMSSAGPTPLQRYARGGVARSPQLAMFGEGSRPEAYVPLPDGRSIPVTMSNGGGNVNNISVNVAIEGGQTQTQTSAGGKDNTEDQTRRLGVAISNAVKQEIFNQQRPGGLLYKGRR
jgi:hypothetical protein